MAEERSEHGSWPPAPQEAGLIMRVFSGSRYFAAFAVFGSFLAAITLYVYGALVVIQTVWETLLTEHVSVEGVQHLQVEFIEMTDVFLLGTVLFIVAFGLYQLFIQPNLPVPLWLRIQNLDQLSERLIEVVCVLLSVTFLAFAVGRVIPDRTEESAAEVAIVTTSQVSLIELGVSVGIVIAALSLLLVVSHRRSANHG
jgi:uncharacterized membrane protein YqhA